ncbi:alpha/beta hydrolase [Candidatus Saccharibacteria bacterium]|nr:alpha/beta hydrolase [Candidatus Saccharibacteria bacterium]
MANAILIHGFCKKKIYMLPGHPVMSENHWFPWLKTELCQRGILTANPELPRAWAPDYKSWKRELERHDINEDTILIAHSYGCAFLIRWLGETNKTVGKIVLVTPYMGIDLEKDLPPEVLAKYDFFKFDVDPNLAKKTRQGLTIFKSTDDFEKVNKSIDILLDKWGDSVKLITLKDRGHFQTREKWIEFKFPELLEEVISE